MSVNSLGNLTGLQQYLSTSPISAARGLDSDSDSSSNAGSQGSNTKSATSPAFFSQISGAGKAKHAHAHHSHGTFNAQNFTNSLDTSGLTSDQQKTLQTVLSKYNGTQMNGDKMNQLVTDLKNAGLNTQMLFDNFQVTGVQQAGGNIQNLSNGKNPSVSTIA